MGVLTEDDFRDSGWQVSGEEERSRRAWSLHAIAADSSLAAHVGALVSVQGRDGYAMFIRFADWASETRTPVLRLEDEVLVFAWEGSAAGDGQGAVIRDVTAIHFAPGR